jgi:hypothetical protein
MALNTLQLLAITETNALLDHATLFWDANILLKFVMTTTCAQLIHVPAEAVYILLLSVNNKAAKLFLVIPAPENVFMLM